MNCFEELTRAQKKNLALLATYLENLPEDYKHFDMTTYNSFGDAEEETYRYAKKNGGLEQFECGTVACAVGHGPSAGVLFRHEATKGKNRAGKTIYLINWEKYSERFVPHHTHPLWYWFFAYDWARYDNTPHGAAARIRYILDGNDLPRDYSVYGIEKEDVGLYSKYLKKDNINQENV